MEQIVMPYELPGAESHSFFFIDQRVRPDEEAKMHRHDAWELYCVIQGEGHRTVGDTQLPFSQGEVALLPPNIDHQWEYEQVGEDGCAHYLMAVFTNRFIEKSISLYPELRRSLSGCHFPADAILFGPESAAAIRDIMDRMTKEDDIGRLCSLLRLIPLVFKAHDIKSVGKAESAERGARRLQRVETYVSAHFARNISIAEIASEVGMSRSAFCSYFKSAKGSTFRQFLAEYRLAAACEILRSTEVSVTEICYKVGYNDMPHFVRVFTKAKGLSPTKWRKKQREIQ